MAGGSYAAIWRDDPDPRAAMEPRPDGRGKYLRRTIANVRTGQPQWSPGLMAGGRSDPKFVAHATSWLPQWSPGLMAGGSSAHDLGDWNGQ